MGVGFAAMRWVILLALLGLAACGSARAPRSGAGAAGDWSCVPYVRVRTGLPIRGDAWQWWDGGAAYARGQSPRAGSVLVLRRTSRLPQGHVSVVARVVSSREIRVDHANWASGSGKGRVAQDQPVLDVSPGNDWSTVRVWYPPVNAYGTTAYPAYGFIHPG